LEVVSSDNSDNTQTVTIIGEISSTGDTEDIALKGTTPVKGIAHTWDWVTAIKLDAACAGTVTIRTFTGPQTTITTVEDGVTDKGVIAITNGDVYSKVSILASDGFADEHITFLGTVIGGSPDYHEMGLNGTTEVTSTSRYEDITELHYGAVQSDDTLTFQAQYGWVWTQYSTTVAQNGTIAFTVGATEQVSLEYDGVRVLSAQGGEDIVEAENAGQITARATAEGGTGKYEHVETVSDRYDTVESQTLATALISQFGALPSTVRLSTDSAAFRIGTAVNVTLSKHDISATDYVLQGMRFHERDVQEGGGRNPYVWTLDLSSQNVTRNWVTWFKRVFDWRP
jgi:hypothetical protein